MKKEIFVIVVVKEKNRYQATYANNPDNAGYGNTIKEAIENLLRCHE